jgi:hypothetical protein
MPFQRKYPPTMLRVMMRKAAQLHSADARQMFAAEAKEIQQREGSLLRSAPVSSQSFPPTPAL